MAETENYLGDAATATFEIKPTVIVSTSANGSVDVKPAAAKPGDKVTLTLKPNAGYDGEIKVTADGGQISAYAKEALSWAVAVGLIAGMDDNTVALGDNSTRAQIAAILTRFCETMQ